jgi:hypothetical protein
LTTITRHFTLKFRFSSVVYNQLLTDKSDPADKLGNDYPNNVRHKTNPPAPQAKMKNQSQFDAPALAAA